MHHISIDRASPLAARQVLTQFARCILAATTVRALAQYDGTALPALPP